MISSLAAEHHFPISIHNQETSSEDEFFRSGTGPLAQMLTKLHTARDDSFAGKPSSLQAYLPLLPRENNILLVHNTYTSEKDIEFALSLHPNLFWVLCPNANLYIENKLPPVEMLRRNHCSICLGTDSLASNNAISLLDELKTLSFFFPEISLHEALTWACHNGARALGMESILGSFEPGKQPGIVLIEYADHINLRLTPQAKARRIDIRNYHVSEPVS
jgi:cytosine/adenosine deaminase-related metal-dependent hydrolase